MRRNRQRSQDKFNRLYMQQAMLQLVHVAGATAFTRPWFSAASFAAATAAEQRAGVREGTLQQHVLLVLRAAPPVAM